MKFKNLHSWDLNPRQALGIQSELKRKIKLEKYLDFPKLIAGVDVAFKKGLAIGAVVVLNYTQMEIIEQVRKTAKITYPYIPGLLTFREGPVLEECFRALKNTPQVIIFDGQGLAHPRNMGIATHMGILLNRRTIGCAKTHLFGDYVEPENQQGAFTYLFDRQQKKIGAVLRTRDFVKPIFVSPGYKMDIKSSIKIILMCVKKYRLPEVIRLAHYLAS